MSIKVEESGTIVVTGPQSINLYRLVAILSAMKLEAQTGMKMSRGVNVFAMVKREYGFKGNKKKLIGQFEKVVDAAKAAHGQS